MTAYRKFLHYAATGLLLLWFCATVSVSAQEQGDVIAAVMAAAEPEVIQSIESPDGLSYAEVTVYSCVDIGEQEASYERLDLVDKASGETKLVAEQVIYCGGLGAYGLWVQRWTQNNAYLYYTDAREGQPDGLATAWVPPLYRVQPETMQVQPLGQAYWSPDGQQLAALSQAQITVIASDSPETVSFDLLPDLYFTNLLWLPDGSGLIYIQADAPFAATRSVVTYLDLEAGEQTRLLVTES